MPILPPATLAALRNAHPDRDFLLLSASISRKLHRELALLLGASRRHTRCTIFLCTLGGDSDAGYRIARCLQDHYEHIRLVIPSYCKSAGTLIAIGAHELAIGDLGELGPLDMQIAKPTELNEHGSALDVTEALNAISLHISNLFLNTLVEIRRNGYLSTLVAARFAARIASSATAPLYSQIDPVRLGAIQRAIRIANHYGDRLNQATGALLPDSLEKLIGDYPSHSFVIDRSEAMELFKYVQCPSPEELAVCDQLWDLLSDPAEISPACLKEEQNEKSI